MAVFLWEAKGKDGKKITGDMKAYNAVMVKAELRKQGIVARKVRKKLSLFSARGKKITPADIALFTRQIATMLKAGVPMLQSFDITIEGMDNPSLKTMLTGVRNDVAGGSTFAEALRKQPQYFDDLYCNLVASGEQSGALETLLDRIATYKEKTEALKKKIKKAMNYPIAVVVVAGIVTSILLIKVVPQFEEIFQGFGAELPAFTQVVINISRFLQTYWYLMAGGIAGVFVLFRHYLKTKAGREKMDRLLLKLPIVGEILDKSAVARYARTLATTFSAGVPLVDALDFVGKAAGNIVYANAVKEIKDAVSSGQQLQFAMKNTHIFPSMAVQMVAIGEESGALDDMLSKVASHYEEEVDNTVNGLTSLMEPIIMSVLGVLVGGLIIAMYLPIFKMGSVVQ